MYKKRHMNAHSVRDVVEANTGIKFESLGLPERPDITGMDEMLKRLKICKDRQETVRVISDYDMDGHASGTILTEALREFLGREVICRPPHRFSEGYGMNCQMVREAPENVLVTVDNGIAAIEPIALAKQMGKTVLVIDHHMPREDGILPCADVIIDPHVRGGYANYCAAGLALRLAEKLVPDSRRIEHWKALAAVGTVADVVDLIGDNRRIVREGLNAMRRGTCGAGLKRLISRLRIEEPTEDDIGYSIAPCCNAAGRLLDEGSEFVMDILMSEPNENSFTYDADMAALDAKVFKLIELNKERQDLVRLDMESVRAVIKQKGLNGRKAIILDATNGDDRQAGWVGILAGKIAEECKCISCVFTQDPNDRSMLKGSGRTYGNVHLKNLLDRCSDLLSGYGGHAGAAGLRLRAENLGLFAERMESLLAPVAMQDDPSVMYDLDARPDEFPKLIQELSEGAPYGAGNPAPVFRATFKLIPKNGKYFEYLGVDTVKMYGQGCEILAFRAKEEYEKMGTPLTIETVGTLSENVFLGNRRLQFTAEAICPAKEESKNVSALKQTLIGCLAGI